MYYQENGVTVKLASVIAVCQLHSKPSMMLWNNDICHIEDMDAANAALRAYHKDNADRLEWVASGHHK